MRYFPAVRRLSRKWIKMKLRLLISSLLFAVLGLTSGARAQDTGKNPAAAEADKQQKEKAKGNTDKPAKPEKPAKDDKPKTEVEDIKSDFQVKADEYLKRQRELLTELK